MGWRAGRRLSGWLLAIMLAGCAGGGDSPDPIVSRRACEQLRNHLVERRLASVTADRAQHEAALRGALGESFLEECAHTFSSDDMACLLAATTTDALGACPHE